MSWCAGVPPLIVQREPGPRVLGQSRDTGPVRLGTGARYIGVTSGGATRERSGVNTFSSETVLYTTMLFIVKLEFFLQLILVVAPEGSAWLLQASCLGLHSSPPARPTLQSADTGDPGTWGRFS